jgi:hypothetical protein
MTTRQAKISGIDPSVNIASQPIRMASHIITFENTQKNLNFFLMAYPLVK